MNMLLLVYLLCELTLATALSCGPRDTRVITAVQKCDDNSTWCTVDSYATQPRFPGTCDDDIDDTCRSVCRRIRSDSNCRQRCGFADVEDCPCGDPLPDVFPTLTRYSISATTVFSTITISVCISPSRDTQTSILTATKTVPGPTVLPTAVTQTSCSQGPVPTTTPDTPLPLPNRGTNTISMATMGVLTGVLLLALVTVTAGWIRTCHKSYRSSWHSQLQGDGQGVDKDISMKENEAYGGVVRHPPMQRDTVIYDVPR